MNRYYSYLNTAKRIISIFNGEEPLSVFLKKFFSQEKKYGSGDRKQITHICYSYYRLGHALPDIPIEERVVVALFLCPGKTTDLVEFIKPEWKDKLHLPLKEKIEFLGLALTSSAIFPWIDEVGRIKDSDSFIFSHLDQPDLFLRIRPGKGNKVREKLSNHEIQFKEISENCVALPNATKVDSILELNSDAVVQDYSSQQTATLLELVKENVAGKTNKIETWDCCVASGGKSILAKDVFTTIDLTVSDIRASILSNLVKRLEEAGIRNYKSFKADLTGPVHELRGEKFDLVIADVPCSGSGTWSRTPEQLYFFKKEMIEGFSALQKKIISNVTPHLKVDGYLLYITCSVFKKENEEVVQHITDYEKLNLVTMKWFEGYDKKADTLFAALLKKDT